MKKVILGMISCALFLLSACESIFHDESATDPRVRIGVAEQALSAAGADADVTTGDPDEDELPPAGNYAVAPVAGGDAPEPAEPPTTQVPADVQALAGLLPTATSPGGGMAPMSVSCDDCDYWREESGTVIRPVGGQLSWLWAGAQVWGPDYSYSGDEAVLEIVKSSNQHSMALDDDTIEARWTTLKLQRFDKKGVEIWGPDANTNTNKAALKVYDGSTKLFIDGNEIQSNSTFYLNLDSKEDIIILGDGGGKVGIGTRTPQSVLDVDGTIRAEQLEVPGSIHAYELTLETGWSDFVFEDDYPLMSLGEVEQYIADNGHLPGMPSASEVEEHGLPVGDSQALLLQKVEELTLYVIEQNRQIAQQAEQIAQQGRHIAELSARIEQCR